MYLANPNWITCPTWRNLDPLLTKTLPVLCLLQLFPGTDVPPTPKDSSLYNIPGFCLLSPILCILAYDSSNRSALDIFVNKRPISSNFTYISKTLSFNGISAIKGLLVAVLLGLLCVALVQGKKKTEEDEGLGRMEGTNGK
ncbi:hypothetical protein AAC387_Pa06g1280 [Persea americana]